jgi:hypothetical protein
LSGLFSPFDPFLYCLNPIVLHVTLRSMLPSLQQTQHKHPCPRWDFFCLSGVFPLWSIFVLFKSYRPSCHFTFHATVLTTNTTQTSMPLARFEPTIPVSERPKTHAWDRPATGIGETKVKNINKLWPLLTLNVLVCHISDGHVLRGWFDEEQRLLVQNVRST